MTKNNQLHFPSGPWLILSPGQETEDKDIEGIVIARNWYQKSANCTQRSCILSLHMGEDQLSKQWE